MLRHFAVLALVLLASPAAAHLAKAAPDGYTIRVGTAAGLAINPAILKANLGYNADKDFAYLHLMAIQPNLASCWDEGMHYKQLEPLPDVA